MVSLLSILISKVSWKIGHEQEEIAIIKLHQHEPTVVIKNPTAAATHTSARKRNATPVSRESSPFPVFVDENAVAANTRARKPHVEPALVEDTLLKKPSLAAGKKVSTILDEMKQQQQHLTTRSHRKNLAKRLESRKETNKRLCTILNKEEAFYFLYREKKTIY